LGPPKFRADRVAGLLVPVVRLEPAGPQHGRLGISVAPIGNLFAPCFLPYEDYCNLLATKRPIGMLASIDLWSFDLGFENSGLET